MLWCRSKAYRCLEHCVCPFSIYISTILIMTRSRFSGDTQPTNTLVNAGRDATLLIHEATMADDQLEMAKKKAHSTFGQAIDIGRR
jgi:ribonuclease BN (tRNA processing enzyme)